MGSRTDSRQIRESSREFATESTREFARVRESSREFASEFAIEFAKPKDAQTDSAFTTDPYTAGSRIDADSRTDSQWDHKGSYPMFTIHRCESVYGI